MFFVIFLSSPLKTYIKKHTVTRGVPYDCALLLFLLTFAVTSMSSGCLLHVYFNINSLKCQEIGIDGSMWASTPTIA